uniref:UDP-N-acetylglucosamine diphosphorylase/glucosamine-1-phosphate N-acetyltransferase n=1 Tax=uncultured organism TaxID=155900 RepID=M1Q2M3_9ZZZZ|nr:UDP-N-acetylglucosamine diphosphorylase/glucosamine-1-phosphate N-acetyltransferase [uncultured organism]
MMANILSVVLAAGKGTRMKSNMTKVLHQVGGKPMVEHILDTVEDLSSETICIVGHQADRVKDELKDREVKFVTQSQQLGTGHAVSQARKYFKEHKGPVLILCGDTPLLNRETLQYMVEKHQEEGAGITILTARLNDPAGYGRIIRNREGQVEKIVEEEDANEKERKIKEINSGVYCFNGNLLAEALGTLTDDNAQGEYYLPDTLNYVRNQNKKIIPVVIENNREIIGINDRKDLAEAEKILRTRINDYHMNRGITIIDPDNTYIDSTVRIGRDTVIYPYTFIERKTVIGSETVIGPQCRLVNAKIGDETNLKSGCKIYDSEIGNRCNIGPFAYIRPGCRIADEVKIGDYVELKKAQVGSGSKVPHLSYVGDAEIGEGTNIGAGTIFANYDGEKKHKTTVGDKVFIGSNTTLVAPVEVKNRGKTGAGAVVTKNVQENTTVVGVPARKFTRDKNEEDH